MTEMVTDGEFRNSQSNFDDLMRSLKKRGDGSDQKVTLMLDEVNDIKSLGQPRNA